MCSFQCRTPNHSYHASSAMGIREEYRHQDPIHRSQVYMLQRPSSPNAAVGSAVDAAAVGMHLDCRGQDRSYSGAGDSWLAYSNMWDVRWEDCSEEVES